jgi:UDP-N-acetylglucosamine 4,6-dehydratase
MTSPSFAVAGARVLVTGGTGSIGSAVVRVLLDRPVAAIRILGRSESTQIELRDRLPSDPRLEWWIGDVREPERMREATRGIDTVIHAAALKHVAICEENPTEAIATNVKGTERLLRAALSGELRRFLLISSDKAVEPCGVLGESKRRAEAILAAAQREGVRAELIALRLGNVLGSRGSVLPRVLERLRRRAPVEIVAPPATRFLLTLGEAAAHALDALESGRGGDVLAPRLPAAQVGELIERCIARSAPHFGLDPVSVERRSRPLHAGEKAHESIVAAAEAGRTRSDGRWFRVSAESVTDGLASLPAECCSQGAPRLDANAIDGLLERSEREAAFLAAADGVVS